MQEINTDNDTHVFKIGIKDNGIVFVDGFELVSRCTRIESVADGKEPSTKDIADAMRDIAWCEGDCKITEFSDDELFSVGCKVLVRIENLGNV